MLKISCILFLLFCGLALCDIYLHNPRGSNDRLNEATEDRDNPNRIFDSQNNDKGGYAWGPSMYYYVGSILQVEWTNQHGCAFGDDNCNIILQYMCDPGLRDGWVNTTDSLNTINPAVPESEQWDRGRDEPLSYFLQCIQRDRNTRLFTADQVLQGTTAQFTRQNPDGTQYGTECPEERDYYPYWSYAPWKDIVIFTDNTTLCPMYQAQSQNVVGRGNCSIVTYNNQFDCVSNGGAWSTVPAWGIPPPLCIQASWTRDNHLGNSIGGQMFNFNWTIPNDINPSCALRIRYNISTGDFPPWNTDATFNTVNSPVYEDEQVLVAGINLTMNINTNQYGRTFQDRSFQFEIRERPANIPTSANIYNLNVRGKRGNIVEVYPAVEYDYVPNRLHVHTGDFIHFQWTGSDYNPTNYEGNGTPGTDRSNIVQILDLTRNLPINTSSIPQGLIASNSFFGSTATSNLFATLGQTDSELDNSATPYFDGGLIQMKQTGNFYFMGTRNNDFSNRSQKGAIYVTSEALKVLLNVWPMLLAVAFYFTC